MTSLSDQSARDRIRDALDVTLVVEAAAGTGKTTELVSRVLALLCQGRAKLSSLVAVTFTEKAAGEMKLRLRTEIEKARAAESTTSEARARLDAALEELEAAHIGTIHGFCADLLRERPVEARVDPLFEVAAEDAKDRLYEESFESWYQEKNADPPEGVRRVLRRRSRERDAQGPSEALRRAGAALIEQRDFDTPWRRDPFEREPSIDAVLTSLDELSELAPRGDARDFFADNLREIARFMSELHAREAVRGGGRHVSGSTGASSTPGRDYDGLEAELRTLSRHWTWRYSGRGKFFAKGLARDAVVADRDAARARLERLLEQADADLASCLFKELRPLVDRYELLKGRTGKLDFLDLLILTRNLLRDDRAVRNELQARYTHLLVDEFQDTDPLQAEILLLIAADDPAERDAWVARPIPGKLFVVGDPKQSIYRFRRADVALYEGIKRRLMSQGAELVHLTTSFRSAPSIQHAVNTAFAPLMQGGAGGSQAEYVALQPFREEPRGRPTVVALPVPRPYGDYRKVTTWRIDESIPDAVGAFVDWLIRKSNWTITERDSPNVPVSIQARHVCLLFKRFQNFRTDVTRLYVRALEARQIPHVLVGGRSFHAREEILAVRNALSAIEWPDDDFSVFATLRGPFFAITDDALLAFRHDIRSLHALSPIDASKLNDLTRPIAAALEILASLHRGRNRRPIADTISRLLEATRAHAGIAIWPSGEQALANLLRVIDFARRFEASGATSFRAFVRRLEDDAERGGAAEAPVVEEGTDGVRIMTVHKAKGLEFPVVILVDPTAPPAMREPSRYVDATRKLWAMPLAGCTPIELVEHREEVLKQDSEEAVRLAYVAATRARELLVVPVVGDEEVDGWVKVLHPVLYPAFEDRRASSPAPGCPTFGEDSVLERPASVSRDVVDSVRPGLHRPRAGEHRVVWWAPSALELGKEDEIGLRQQRILAADEGESVANEGERLHVEWQARRAAVLERGAVPTIAVRTFSEAKQAMSEGGTAKPVPIEETDASRANRPHGKRFGTLVHAVLAAVDLAGDDAAVTEVARAQGRLLGASSEEIDAAALATKSALRHPLLARARAATGNARRREAPVSLRLADGSLVDGVLDLAFREHGEQGPVWIVVDFKTDVELGARRAEYSEQVALYARAVATATGEDARGVLLSV